VERFLASTPLEREVDRDLFAEGLLRAGIPERDPVVASVATIGAHELRGVS
jgi:hypothetical protein